MNTAVLKRGGEKSSGMALTALPNGKPVTSSNQVKVLTKSEIQSLRDDLKKASDLLIDLIKKDKIA